MLNQNQKFLENKVFIKLNLHFIKSKLNFYSKSYKEKFRFGKLKRYFIQLCN